MIKRLQISNYAIIEQLDMAFSPGLTIITGETGAGKSILLGALGLILGGRADTKSLFNAEEKCIIEAHFDLSAYQLKTFFAKQDLDYEDELIVRRELTPTGKSRAFVNDTPVNLKVLQELGASLIDLHQQFDTLYVNNEDFQLQLLDALAQHPAALADYQNYFEALQKAKKRLKAVKELSSQAQREQEFIQFQHSELFEANLQANEQESLENEQSRLANADEIQQVCAAIYRLLSEDEVAISDQLLLIQQQLSPLARTDQEINSIKDRFSSLQLELDALAEEISKLGENTENDPQRLSEVNQRLDQLYRLQTKHNVGSIAELLAIQEQLGQQLLAFSDLSQETEQLEQAIEKLSQQLVKSGEKIRQARQQVVPDFTRKAEALLAELAMPNAKLVVEFSPLAEASSKGLDEVVFLFSANKGGRLLAIKDAASGGEMSRLALVTKSLVATAMALPTLIFDEIDSGVSGDVALKMGGILQRLAQHHQVVVITHSPQVASKAQRHFHIYKTDKGAQNRTITKLKELNEEERIRAIATMLSQSPPSASALENARELMAM